MAAPPILSCKSARNTMYILLTISFIITPSLGQSHNVALHKTVDQSSTLDYPSGSPWSASYAVDGRIPGDINSCRCCSSTNKDSKNSLTLDLGDIYTIYSIYVLARTTDVNGRLNLANMYISNTTSMAALPTYTHFQQTPKFTWNATEGTFARYVKLTRPSDEYLIVCEIMVFKRDCTGRRYGPTCAQECLNCATCNQTGGNCLRCIDGTYGDTCQQHCSVSCAEPFCDMNNGHCSTCIDGKYGNTCQDICSVNCAGSTCKKDSGHCNTCVGGKYGDTCSNNCPPHCEGNVCDRMKGHCMTGCKPGYTGNNCYLPCHDGRYGNNCTATCGHCLEAAKCNKIDGICMTGCMPGYKPGNCTEDFSIHPRINGTFTTSQSTTYSNWSSSLAVDGKLGPDADSCQCCSSTNATPTDKWWSIDLHQQYLVQYVQIYSRTRNEKPQQIQGIQVVIANSTDGSRQTIFNDTSESGEHVYNIKVIPVRPLQIVEILRSSPEPLVICEVKIFETFCELGHYGYNCSRSCNCGDKQICHTATGHCKSSSCLPGWKGPSCEEECDEGFYGQNCTFKCGICAASPCSFIDGTCTDGCAGGVTGYLCKESLTQDASSSPVIGAAVGSVAAVVFIGIIAAVVYAKRNRLVGNYKIFTT